MVDLVSKLEKLEDMAVQTVSVTASQQVRNITRAAAFSRELYSCVSCVRMYVCTLVSEVSLSFRLLHS